ARKQLFEPGIPHSGDGGPQIGVELLDVAFRVRQKIAEVVIALSGGDDLLERQLLPAVVEFHAAADLDNVIAFERRRKRGKVFPHFRRDRARAVGKFELKPRRAGARRRTHFFFADEKERSDCLAVGEIGDEMRFHEPPAFGKGSFFLPFFLSWASGVGATSWITVAPET